MGEVQDVLQDAALAPAVADAGEAAVPDLVRRLSRGTQMLPEVPEHGIRVPGGLQAGEGGIGGERLSDHGGLPDAFPGRRS
jgi:hypothetical protein